jgi:beta-N-acetylhexosaminidase
MHSKRPSAATALLVIAGVLPGATPVTAASVATPVTAAAPSVGQLIGQKLMVAMSGTVPSAGLLQRIELGQVGGVILFGSNIESPGQVAALTARLRAASAAGGQPPLLISTDQEGGSIKRLPWVAPTISVPQMGAKGSSATAFSQGKATGVGLECDGINNDLAPVADVPASTSSFMYQQGRTWSFSASTTATLSDAFASGLVAGNTVPAMKHFPGIGRATQNTDTHAVTITASRSTLAAGLTPYQKAIGHGIPMIMLSNATYSAYDSVNAAGWSHAISVDLLRTTLGFTGVSITDSLNGAAASRGVSVSSLAIKAAKAGTDMILLSSSEAASAATYASLVTAAKDGSISTSVLQRSYDRILALKASLTAPAPDTTAPTVGTPLPNLFSISSLGSTTVPVRTAWTATDGCGIVRSSLERQVDGGSWTAQGLAGASSLADVQSLRLGSTYRYRARATDGAGNRSGWRYGPAFRPLLSQQTSAAITYGGTWATRASSSASGGSLAAAWVASASATYTFTGQAVGWVASRGPTRGSARVYVDGVDRGTVSLYATTGQSQQIVFATHWASNGSHTLRIVNLGTAGHSRVDVDGFVRLLDL